MEDDANYTNANSSPAMLAHAICWELKALLLLDRPLLAGHLGGKGSNNDGGTGGSGKSWIPHRIGMVLLSTPQAMAIKVVGE
jgi:hypothetical protein